MLRRHGGIDLKDRLLPLVKVACLLRKVARWELPHRVWHYAGVLGADLGRCCPKGLCQCDCASGAHRKAAIGPLPNLPLRYANLGCDLFLGGTSPDRGQPFLDVVRGRHLLGSEGAQVLGFLAAWSHGGTLLTLNQKRH